MDLPILLYHHLVGSGEVKKHGYEISLRQFEMHLDILKKAGFATINFRTLFRILEGTEKPSSKMAIITFDDALESFYKLGVQALLPRGMQATLFVPAGLIGESSSWETAGGAPVRPLMNEEQLREVASMGIEIGSHGWKHRSLPECSAEEVREELFASRERLLGMDTYCNVFAYPYGHNSAECRFQVEAAGYRGAVSIFSAEKSVTSDHFAMRRAYIHQGDNALRFRLKLTKAFQKYQAMHVLR